MSTWGPIIAIVLALLAVACIAMIAWKLSSDKFYTNLENDRADRSDPDN